MKVIKTELYKLCVQSVEQKADRLKDAIKKAQESANSDTKSSMGDKYETGRAMAQLEIEKNTGQLIETQNQMNVLSRISPSVNSDIIGNGSLVISSSGNYYISVSAGLFQLKGNSYFVISIQSPIGLKMKGLKKDDEFTLNNKVIRILEVY